MDTTCEKLAREFGLEVEEYCDTYYRFFTNMRDAGLDPEITASLLSRGILEPSEYGGDYVSISGSTSSVQGILPSEIFFRNEDGLYIETEEEVYGPVTPLTTGPSDVLVHWKRTQEEDMEIPYPYHVWRFIQGERVS